MHRNNFWRFFGQSLAGKDHITWWMRAADFRDHDHNRDLSFDRVIRCAKVRGPHVSGSGNLWPKFFTLPALQKHFVDFFFKFAWEFCIEKRQGFLVNFFWSPFPTKQSTKTPEKIRGKFGAKFGAKFGTKIRKIRGLFVLHLFWPKNSCQSRFSSVYLVFEVFQDIWYSPTRKIPVHAGMLPSLVPWWPQIMQIYPPPPREKITKIIRREYSYVILGSGYGKIT